MALALAGLAMIAYATLCPIEMRPHLASANEERFGAYFVLGFLGALAVPRQLSLVSISLVLIAFGLEWGQRFVPTRDPALADAIVKAFGGMLGAQCGVTTFTFRRWLMQKYGARTSGRPSQSRGAVRYQRS
jgi:VanZ family protein